MTATTAPSSASRRRLRTAADRGRRTRATTPHTPAASVSATQRAKAQNVVVLGGGGPDDDGHRGHRADHRCDDQPTFDRADLGRSDRVIGDLHADQWTTAPRRAVRSGRQVGQVRSVSPSFTEPPEHCGLDLDLGIGLAVGELHLDLLGPALVDLLGEPRRRGRRHQGDRCRRCSGWSPCCPTPSGSPGSRAPRWSWGCRRARARWWSSWRSHRRPNRRQPPEPPSSEPDPLLEPPSSPEPETRRRATRARTRTRLPEPEPDESSRPDPEPP